MHGSAKQTKKNSMSVSLYKSIVSRSRKMLILFYFVLIRLHIKQNMIKEEWS